MFDEATRLLGFSMPELCFEPNDRLDITEYTQAAMVTTSIAMMKVFMERTGIRPDVAAGLSLGEYCALAAAGVMSEADAITTVRQRGILMQEAVPAGVGAMAAVLAMDAAAIETVIAPIEGVQIANYNCPGQIVISGLKEAVETAGREAERGGSQTGDSAERQRPLPFPDADGSRPEAGRGVGKDRGTYAPDPLRGQCDGAVRDDAAQVKPLLEQQVYSSVRWQQSVETMLADGVDTFIEIGPGKTLSGFVKKISRDVKVLNIEKMEDLEKF